MDQGLPPDASKRLLNTTTYQLVFDNDEDFQKDPRYGIVSHRWLKDEITFQTIQSKGPLDTLANGPALQKVIGACNKARKDGLKWLWLDSVCINKANMVEDVTAIKSMFQWYRHAEVCYTYLFDVVAPSKATVNTRLFDRIDQPGKSSVWFERGWTLQELLAPTNMNFYDRNWQYMGTKYDLAQPLAAITGIDAEYLRGKEDFLRANVAVKMSWMAGRKTSKVEDLAYSMLGIFNVDMIGYYGDGMKAFIKLQEEIIRVSNDETIFAWTTPPSSLPTSDSSTNFDNDEWGLLAPPPDCFRNSGDIVIDSTIHPRRGGYKLEQRGLVFPFPRQDFVPDMKEGLGLIPVVGPAYIIGRNLQARKQMDFALTLNCLRMNANRELMPVQVYLRRSIVGGNEESLVFRRTRCSELGLATKRKKTYPQNGKLQMVILHPYPKRWIGFIDLKQHQDEEDMEKFLDLKF